ncbi:hypothetical protein RIR_jg34229.t1 [Rhizophagus irregularis DAOM 181602=DAOM 197198]|nr:hypothetical protein RIR_jg34229.t1 [Rhizophagus irregularis DAOM 181602=DAOM 197198]
MRVYNGNEVTNENHTSAHSAIPTITKTNNQSQYRLEFHPSTDYPFQIWISTYFRNGNDMMGMILGIVSARLLGEWIWF